MLFHLGEALGVGDFFCSFFAGAWVCLFSCGLLVWFVCFLKPVIFIKGNFLSSTENVSSWTS